jgi:hypothetical protein
MDIESNVLEQLQSGILSEGQKHELIFDILKKQVDQLSPEQVPTRNL